MGGWESQERDLPGEESPGLVVREGLKVQAKLGLEGEKSARWGEAGGATRQRAQAELGLMACVAALICYARHILWWGGGLPPCSQGGPSITEQREGLRGKMEN